MQKLTPDTKLTYSNLVGTYWESTKEDLPRHLIMIVAITDSFTKKETVGPICLAGPKNLVGFGDGCSLGEFITERQISPLFEDYRQLSQVEYLYLMQEEFSK